MALVNLKNKTVCFVDIGGVYTPIAEAVREDFANVLYWTPWDSSFHSEARNMLPGIGLDGIERVADFYDDLDRIDLFVFPDVGYGALQEDLRRRGWPVFGSGAAGKLEQDRLFLKQMCEEAGIETAKYGVVQGLDQLRKVLNKDFDCFVKMSYFRWNGETFKHETKVGTESRLAEMALHMGPYKDLVQFIVELPIADDDGPCVEVGFDSFCTDGVFPKAQMWGYEAKDAAYVGTTAPLAPRVKENQDKIAPVLASLGYRGAFCSETREDSNGTFFLDATCRFGSPPSEVQSKFITNLADILWGVANGEVVEPEFAARYAAQLVINSSWYAEHPIALTIDRPDRVAIHGHCRFGKMDYAASVTEIPQLAGAIGMGNTMEDAVKEAFEVAEGVKGRDVSYDSGALNKALETIQEGEKLGIAWSSLKGA